MATYRLMRRMTPVTGTWDRCESVTSRKSAWAWIHEQLKRGWAEARFELVTADMLHREMEEARKAVADHQSEG